MRRPPRGFTLKRALIVIGVLLTVGVGCWSRSTCVSLGLSKGIWLDQCPDGELRQLITVGAPALKRGAAGTIAVEARAVYVIENGGQLSHPLKRFTPEVSLVAGDKVTPLPPKKGWETAPYNSALTAEVELPQVNDGDYVLRTRVVSSAGDTTLDLPLPLYAPATIHVLTDRPLYEPGNTVRFRAVALKAADLTPLEERPGVWTVMDPSGEVLLEEKAPSGSWGVVAGSFPLDKGAQSGEWRVTWSSGGSTQTRSFTVKPFTLPRFKLEAETVKPFYRRGEKPVLKGTVKYSSGAPVANAKVELRWRVHGDWPPPTNWLNGGALPKSATTNANGAFTVELPQVPSDLVKQVTLAAALSAIDPSGDRVEGAASVLLSEDAIAVQAVPELPGGLVEGFNNRLFLRATTADGRLLRGVTLNVRRLWEPGDKGTDSPVDEDGVASLQVDPGPPVNIVIPALPFRPPPPVRKVTRTNLSEFLRDDGEVTLADRMAFDRLDAKLEPCTRLVIDGDGEVTVALLVNSAGSVTATASAGTRKLDRCVENTLRSLGAGPGKERFFEVSWRFDDSELPGLEAEVEARPQEPEGLHDALADALLDARDCLSANVKPGVLPRIAKWVLKGRTVELTWAAGEGDNYYPPQALACIASRVQRFTLPKFEDGDEPAPLPAIGVARFNVFAPQKYENLRPQDTILTGYEFLVTAKAGNETVGSTKVRMTPGQVPDLRLRASSQLVKPGDTVTVTLLRGPDYVGELPKKLSLLRGYNSIEADVGEESRSASFTIPPEWEGWASTTFGGATAYLFVQPSNTLTVKVTPEKERYAPGQVAQLGIETTVGGSGGRAAVGLFGVDDSLSQLVPLPGGDELATLRPNATGEAAFGSLDAQALTLGRIRGANAKAATLARIQAIPSPPAVEGYASVSGSSVFDPNEAQVDRFYAVLSELSTRVRAWESSAPPTEKLKPPVVAKLWRESLTALKARNESVEDAWGRSLRLHRLPADLLALTAPKELVIDGTRLPEDLENWPQWVSKEKP